jgi:hypothetical protein
MHQMRISTNQVSSVVLRPKKVETRKIVKMVKLTMCSFNIIKTQNANIKSNVGQHGLQQNKKVGSGAADE